MRRAITILTTAVALALGVSSVAHAQSGPFEVQGDNAPNAIAINAVPGSFFDPQRRIELCVDGFCSTEAASSFDTIVVNGFDGDDTLTINQDVFHGFLTNDLGGIDVSFNGGPGNDHLAVCPLGCGVAEIETTEFAPGSGAGQGTISQTQGSERLDIAFDSVGDVFDRSGGSLTVQGTPNDDVTTYGAGGAAGRGRVSMGSLVPYEFSQKTSLTVNGNAGADRLEVDGPGTPLGLTGDCGGGYSVCFDGGSSSGDALVVHGVPAVQDQATLVALGYGAFGEELGAVGGIAATAPVRYAGIESLDVDLQFGADSDRFAVSGSPGDDRFALSPAQAARQVSLTATLDQNAPGAQSLPAVTARSANVADVADIAIDAGEGSDELSYDGTARDDSLVVAPSGAGEQLQHAIDGRLAYRAGLAGFERRIPAGGDGDDTLTVGGDVAGLTDWSGGSGSDTAALAGTGAGQVAISFATGSLHEDGFGVLHTTGTERLDADAAGNGARVDGDASGDTLRYTPSTADSGAVARDSDGRSATVRGVSGVLRLDPLDGQDSVFVRATAGADQVLLTRDGGSDTLTAQVGTMLPARIAASAEAVRAEGAAGEDRFSVAGSGGPESLTVDGGTDPGADALVMTQDVHDAAVRFATDPSAGVVDTGAPPVGFLALETVELEGDSAGTLSISGSGAPDALTQTGNRVTAGAGAAVSFSRFPGLALDGGAGSDQVTLNPRGTSQVDSIDVAGGESSGDTLAVNGTELGEQLRYAPSAPAGGQVDVAGAPPVAFAQVESLALDGRSNMPSGDALVVDTRALDGTQVLEPGATFDAATVQFRDATGATTTAAPLSFARLGTGSLSFDDDARNDRLVYRGSSASDVFSLATAGTVRLGAQVPVHTPGIRTLVLDALDGDDTFNIAADHPFPGADGPGVVTDGGNPDDGDVVNVAGAGIASAVDLAQGTVAAAGFAPAALVGIARLNLDAASVLAVRGGDGPDVLRYTPTGTQAGTFARDEGAPELRFTNLPGTLSADAGDGADEVVVNGRSTADEALIARGDPTTVQVASLKTLQLPAGTESLRLLAGDGADTTTVTGAGGPANLTVTGGLPSAIGDRLVYVGANAEITYDDPPSSGLLSSPDGNVGFLEMELVELNGGGTGSLTVRGTNGNDVFTVGHGMPPQVTINGGAAISIAGYTTLTLDGRGGADTFDVSYAHLGDVTALHIIGGPSLSDVLTVEDRAGAERTLEVHPTAPDAGSVSIGPPDAVVDFESTESLVVDGMGGGDELRLVTPSGEQQVRLTPGATDDAASLQLAGLVPMRFLRLGAGRLRIVDTDGGRADTLTYDGLVGADVFQTIGEPNSVTLNSRIPLLPDAATNLVLNGLDGDDRFAVTGPLPFATTRTDGSGPDRADSLDITGPSGPVTADIGAGTLTGYGGTIGFPGIEQIATDAGGQQLTQVGRTADDALCYDPMSPRSGRAYVVGAPGGGSAATVCSPDQRGTNVLHTFTDVARLVFDPAGGSDQVIVNGTTSADLVTLKLTNPTASVSVHPNAPDPLAFRLPAEVTVATTESLAVAADNGIDTFDVTAFNLAAPTVFLDGEDPAPKRFGDELRVRNGSGKVGYRNVTGHAFGDGTVFADYRDAFTQRIDYTRIEGVTLYK